MAKAQDAAALVEDKAKQEALKVAASAAVARAETEADAYAAAVKENGKKAQEAQKTKAAERSTKGFTTVAQQARNIELPQDLGGWELSKGGLLEGSNLSSSKALPEEYPEDEANSKKTKKTNTGKGKKDNSKPKA